MDNPCVRFDDLSPGGSGSFGLTGQTDTLVARKLDEVVPTIEAAQQAAAAGYWVAGFVGYEAAPAFDENLTVRPAGLHDPLRELPLAHFQVFSTRVEVESIDSMQFPPGAYNVSGWTSESSRREYRDHLASIGRAVMSGEIACAKHTFRLHAAFSGDPTVLYRDLIRSQRGTHAACLDTGRYRIISASPQRFFKRTGELLTASPVLASVRRGRWLEEDQQLAAVLASDADSSYASRAVVKETEAELAQLGELTPVPLPDRLVVERLETLCHLTARIGVTLRPDVGFLEILRATFPSVTLTGVPRRAAMSLLASTEDSPRGVYGGIIGFLTPPGTEGPSASFSIAVRTVVVDREEGVAEYGVGSSITNTSDVVSAYEEARLKARVLVERRPDFELVEQFRAEGGVIRAMDTKVDNLIESAQYFGFEVDRASIVAELRDGSREPGVRQITISVDRSGVVGASSKPAPDWNETPDDAPDLEGVVAEPSVSPDNVYLFHHTTDSRLPDALRREYPTAAVVILVNEHDEVAGSLNGNVLIHLDGKWYTPPRGCGAKPGGLRTRLIESGEAEVRVIMRAQIERADRVAVIDDVHGWQMVRLAG